MRLTSGIVAVLLFSGCDTGTRHYWGLSTQRVEAQGMLFDVRQNGLMAEALRQNFMAMPQSQTVAAAAGEAIQVATRCAVLELRGDPSVIEARLECDGEKAGAFRKRKADLFCDVRTNLSDPEEFEDYYLVCR